MNLRIMTLAWMLLAAGTTWAGEADVEAVEAVPMGENRYRFQVTVRHADEGWDHYADRFDILDAQGNILGTRVLHHPHVDEQPFTRSLNNAMIPPGIQSVRVRARDSRHAYGGREMTLKLPDR